MYKEPQYIIKFVILPPRPRQRTENHKRACNGNNCADPDIEKHDEKHPLRNGEGGINQQRLDIGIEAIDDIGL